MGEHRKLLHYGLQRSGTNFLESLLKRKYRVRFLNSDKDRSSPLQKHFRLYDEKDIVPEPQYYNQLQLPDFASFERLLKVVPNFYIVVSKDPYSWLLSYDNWAKKCNWPAVSHHYILEYNLFYGKWLEFSQQSDKIIFIRYFDLLQDTDEVLNCLASKVGLKKRVLSPFMSSTISQVPKSTRFSNARLNFYLKEKYLKSYNKHELQEVNYLLDPTVVSLLGYEKKTIAG